MNCANCCNNCYMEFYKVEVVPAAELDDQIAQAVLASGVQVDGSTARKSSPRVVKLECSPGGGCGGNCYQCDMNRRGHGFYPLVINVIDAGGKNFAQSASETAGILNNRQSKNTAATKSGKVTFSSREPASKTPESNEAEADEEPTKSMLDVYLESKKKAQAAPAAKKPVSSEQEPEERPPVRVLESGGVGRYPRRFPAQARAAWSAGNQFAFAQNLSRQNSDEAMPVVFNRQFAGVVRRQKKCDENGCRLEEYYQSQ